MIRINKYVLLSLLGGFAIFVAYHLGIIGFLLLCSGIANGYLISKMLKMQEKNENQEEDLTGLYHNIDGLSGHLDKLNNMHVYHMDDNIIALIKHSRSVLNTLIDFQVEYSTEPVIIIEGDDDEEEREVGQEETDSREAEEKEEE